MTDEPFVLPDTCTLSDDGRTLTWVATDDAGTHRGTISWSHDPTVDELQTSIAALEEARAQVRTPDAGYSMCYLFGNVMLYRTWGPPIWWLPHVDLSWRDRSIGIGWLTRGFSLVYKRRPK